MHKSVGGAATLCALALSASPAQALTPLTFATSASSDTSKTSGSSSASGSFCLSGSCGTFTAAAQASGLDGGTVHATVTLTDVPLIPSIQSFYATSASAQAMYGIELLGPAGVMVPVDISSYLSADNGSIYASAQSSLIVSSPIYGSVFSKVCYDGPCYATIPPLDSELVSNGGSTGPAYLMSDVEYIVSLAAMVDVEYGTADAFADPTFKIDDPAFAGQFQLVGIPAAVPEPASWALMLTGFGVAGLLLRNRRPDIGLANA